MQVAGQVRYELQDGESLSEALLHCYIPKDVPGREVDLSYELDGLSKGKIAIHFETVAKGKLGCVELSGYVFPDGIEAKFSKKQSRFTFRLLRTGKSASSAASDGDRDSAAEQDVDVLEHFSDATSSAPSTPTAADSYAAPTANGNHQGHFQEAELGEDADSAADAADQAAAAAAELQEDAADDDDDEDDEQEAGGDSEQQQKKAKKRRGAKKKKKKKTKAGDDAAAAEQDVAAAAAPAPEPVAAAAAEAEDDDEFVDAISSEGADDTTAQQQQEQAEQASSSNSSSPTGSSRQQQQQSRPGSTIPPIVFTSDNYMSHFSEEAVAGSSELPASPEVQVLLPQSLLHGPTVHSCLDKHDVKGEDKGLNLKGCSWTPAGSEVATSFSAFGIFDGHGGKPAATYASKELLPIVMRLVDRCIEGNSSSSNSFSRQASAAAAAVDAVDGDAAGDEAWGIEVTEEDRAVWAAQEALVDRLPKALFAGFLEADKACRSRHRVSGATATLALVVGWELLVANVGDSAAFLDTGKEVIALSGNHRIDDNTAERARILAAGGEISKSTADGKPVGPDRVWPGGLAMSRTIGDPQAPQVIAVPEIRHVTLPTTGGRLVIASDGVWDHMQPKSMIHQVRNASTDAAAKKLAAAALKKKGLRDDISVLVVDLVPNSADTRPPALMLGPARDAVEACQIMRPLMEVEAAAAAAAGADEGDAGASQLQTAASITSVTAGSTAHWRESAAARRSTARRLLRGAKQREWEMEEAEKARLAELAAKAAAEASGAGLSDTYKELAALHIDVDAVIPEVQQRQAEAQQAAAGAAAATAAAVDDGWTTVGGGGAGADGYVSFEQQLRAEAAATGGLQRQQPEQEQFGGPGGRRGSRGGRGGRGARGRGRDSSSYRDEQQGPSQQASDSAAGGPAAAAGGPAGSGEGFAEGGGGFRDGGFRRRGDRSGREGGRREGGRPPRDVAGAPQQQQQGAGDATAASAAASAAALGLGREGGRGGGRGGRGFGGRGYGGRGEFAGRGDRPDQQQQQRAERGERFDRFDRPPRRERGPGGPARQQYQQQQAAHEQQQQQQQQDVQGGEGAPPSSSREQFAGGRGDRFGDRPRGRGGRGRGPYGPPATAAAADGSTYHAEHADAAQNVPRSDQRHQQQAGGHAAAGQFPRQQRQQYAPRASADAGAGAPDAAAANNAADAALHQSKQQQGAAVRVVPRPAGKPFGRNSGSGGAAEGAAADDQQQQRGGGGGGGRGGEFAGRPRGGGVGGYRGGGGGGYRGRGRGPPAPAPAAPQPQQS